METASGFGPPHPPLPSAPSAFGDRVRLGASAPSAPLGSFGLWRPRPAWGLRTLRFRLHLVTASGASAVSAAGHPARLFQEALVVAHHQLGLELLHRVEGHADDNQDRGAAEEE